MHTQRTKWYTSNIHHIQRWRQGLFADYGATACMTNCPYQTSEHFLICCVQFIAQAETATLKENIPQLSCLLGQLCQVSCGWGQSHAGRSMVNSSREFRSWDIAWANSCVTALSASSAIAANVFTYSFIPLTVSKNQSYLVTANQKSVQKWKMGLAWGYSAWESACPCRGQGFDPRSGKIPQAAGQLSQGSPTTEPMCCYYWSPCA